MKVFEAIGGHLNKKMMNGMTEESRRVLSEITNDPSMHSAVTDYGESVATTSYWWGVGVTVISVVLGVGTVYGIDKAQKAWQKHRLMKKAKEWEKVLREEYKKHENEIDKEDINE